MINSGVFFLFTLIKYDYRFLPHNKLPQLGWLTRWPEAGEDTIRFFAGRGRFLMEGFLASSVNFAWEGKQRRNDRWHGGDGYRRVMINEEEASNHSHPKDG